MVRVRVGIMVMDVLKTSVYQSRTGPMRACGLSGLRSMEYSVYRNFGLSGLREIGLRSIGVWP